MKPKVNAQTAAAYLHKISPLRPTLAIVLGSGFHHALSALRVDKKISYAKIPGFPKPTVSGHAGELYFGHLGQTPVLMLSAMGEVDERVAGLRSGGDDYLVKPFAPDERPSSNGICLRNGVKPSNEPNQSACQASLQLLPPPQRG